MYEKLKKRISELERENSKLKRRLVTYERERQKIKRNDGSTEGEIARVRRNRIRFSTNSWFSFAFASLGESSIFNLVHRVASWLRRFSLLVTVWTVVNLALTALTASAAYITVAALFLITLPFTASGFLLALIHTAFSFRLYNRQFETVLKDGNVAVFFPLRGDDMGEGSIFAKSVDAAAREERVAVVVSPYFFSSAGIAGRRPYMTCRHERGRIYMVRRRYYFFFKRRFVENEKYEAELIY